MSKNIKRDSGLAGRASRSPHLGYIVTISVLLLAVLIGCFAVIVDSDPSDADDSGTCGDDLQWSYDSISKTLSITGTGEMYDYYHKSEPPKELPPWDGLKGDIESVVISDSVASIGDYAFYEYSALTSVTIGNSVKSIGKFAFCNCTSLTSVIIPDSVESIKVDAFYGCSALTSVTIGNSVTALPDFMFYGCSALTSVTIPNSVKSIGTSVFNGCKSLTSVIIPDSVTSLGNAVFNNCTSLTSVTIPDSVESIGNNAFKNCTSLRLITIGNSVKSFGTTPFPHQFFISGSLVDEGECGKSYMLVGDQYEQCSVIFMLDDNGNKIPLCYGKAGTDIPDLGSAPVREGYDFDTWCTDKELNNAFDLDKFPESDITVYPKYTPHNDADPKDGGKFPVWIIVVIVGAVAAVGGGLFFILRKKI